MRVKDNFIQVWGGNNRASEPPILTVVWEQGDGERVRLLG